MRKKRKTKEDLENIYQNVLNLKEDMREMKTLLKEKIK